MKQVFTFVASLVVAVGAYAQNFTLLSSSDSQISFKHQLDELGPSSTEILAAEYLNFSSVYPVVMMEEGAPALPTFSESVVLPNQGDVSLEIIPGDYTEYSDVNVAPSKGSINRSVNPSDVPFTFGEAYETDAFFPAEVAKIGDPFVLRTTRGVTVQFSPYQYNPVTKVLRVYHHVQVNVVIDQDEVGINEIDTEMNAAGVFKDVYTNFYLNANDVFGKYSPVEEDGEMLIIADDALMDEMASFVQWKNEKGIRTTMVGTSEAGSTDGAIYSYISDFYTSNPDLVFVLLVGDHAGVPAHSYGVGGWGERWSDSYYGMHAGGSGDYYPELFVGRFSGSSSEITTQVERTLEYETDPAAGDWMTKTIGLASNEGAGIGDDGEPDWQHARNIRTKFLAYGYTEVHEFYDGSQGGADAAGNPSASMIMPAVNAGTSLFNYTGHGDTDVCITGNFDGDDVNSLTNNGYYPFVVSVACNNGTFTSGTCISEDWVRATNSGSPTGAIAAAGSTILMAWAEPMETQDEMAEIITEAYASNYKVTLGGLFYNSQMSMLEDYGESFTAEEVMQTWVLFGDPSCVYRNKETQTLTVTAPTGVMAGDTEVIVACDTDGATIGVSKNGEYLGHGVVSGGTATISIPALEDEDPILITGTKQNYKPDQESADVHINDTGFDSNPLSDIKVYPNPANEWLTVSLGTSSTAEVQLMDITGKVVSLVTVATSNHTFNLSGLGAGVYFLNVRIDGFETTKKVVIK